MNTNTNKELSCGMENASPVGVHTKQLLQPKRMLLLALILALALFAVGCTTSQSATLDNDELYQAAVLDAMVAEEDEIMSLVTLTESDDFVTFNEDGQVLLCTWHRYPDSYPEGEEITLVYGAVWTFTEQEIIAWYSEHQDEMEDTDDYVLRLEQLIGLPADSGYTHVTMMWVSLEDVSRPAYLTDATVDAMQNSYADEMENQEWFDENIISSYFYDYTYPWTRLGYTYDWADNGEDYGLSEFLVCQDADVTIAYTDTTEAFVAYLASAVG